MSEIRKFSEGQKAALRFLVMQPDGEFVYPKGHTSAVCNLVGGVHDVVERQRIKGRWHYRLTHYGRKLAGECMECPDTRQH